MYATIPRIPGYTILGELGRGGMGIVFKAQNLKYDRLVALKMILSGRGADLLELARFRIEAESIGSLAHPNIVRIHEVGVNLGFPYFVLEYAVHGSLAERIRAQSMPCDWTAQVLLKLALAMQHAHERRIIHRDLKPSNVLLMSDDIPKVTDFGLAKFATEQFRRDAQAGLTVAIPRVFHELTRMKNDFERLKETGDKDVTTTFEDFVVRTEWNRRLGKPAVEDDQRLDEIGQFLHDALHQASLELPGDSTNLGKLTRTGAILGTPQYMSPEQASGRSEEVGPAADIYCLGAIMYEMLTGRPPFTGDTYELIGKVTTRPPVPPRQRRDSIDPALEAVCMKCLERKVERRYGSMGELADDLKRFMNGAEVSAQREFSPGGTGGSGASALDELANRTTSASTRIDEPGQTRTKSWWRFWI